MAETQGIPLSALRSRRAEIDEQIRRLKIERDLLDSLMQGAVPITSNGAVKEGPGPREAILSLLEERPGLTATEIAEELEPVVASKATDRKNVLRTTVAKLVGEGVLSRDEERRHRIKPEGGDA